MNESCSISCLGLVAIPTFPTPASASICWKYRKNVSERAEESSEASSRTLPRSFGIRATVPFVQIHLIRLQLQANVAGGLSNPHPSSPSDVHDVHQPWYSFPLAATDNIPRLVQHSRSHADWDRHVLYVRGVLAFPAACYPNPIA